MAGTNKTEVSTEKSEFAKLPPQEQEIIRNLELLKEIKTLKDMELVQNYEMLENYDTMKKVVDQDEEEFGNGSE